MNEVEPVLEVRDALLEGEALELLDEAVRVVRVHHVDPVALVPLQAGAAEVVPTESAYVCSIRSNLRLLVFLQTLGDPF